MEVLAREIGIYKSLPAGEDVSNSSQASLNLDLPIRNDYGSLEAGYELPSIVGMEPILDPPNPAKRKRSGNRAGPSEAPVERMIPGGEVQSTSSQPTQFVHSSGRILSGFERSAAVRTRIAETQQSNPSEVDTQGLAVASIVQSSSAVSTPPENRKCGYCKTVGHNKRTCEKLKRKKLEEAIAGARDRSGLPAVRDTQVSLNPFSTLDANIEMQAQNTQGVEEVGTSLGNEISNGVAEGLRTITATDMGKTDCQSGNAMREGALMSTLCAGSLATRS